MKKKLFSIFGISALVICVFLFNRSGYAQKDNSPSSQLLINEISELKSITATVSSRIEKLQADTQTILINQQEIKAELQRIKSRI
jgi:peptidoglycan hydrolase CwlO-like protein